jgi:hypothetical protein
MIDEEVETKSSSDLKLNRSSTTTQIYNLDGSTIVSYYNDYFTIGLSEESFVWFIPNLQSKSSYSGYLQSQGDFTMSFSVFNFESENQLIKQAKKDLKTSEISIYFEGIINKINHIPFKDIIFEDIFGNLTIKLKLSSSFLLVLTFPDEESYKDTQSAIYTLMDEDDVIVRNVQPINEIIAGIKKFLDEPNVSIQDKP